MGHDRSGTAVGVLTTLQFGPLVPDIVGPEDLANAVSLNMTVGSVSRALGPALAGVTIAVLGVGPCFLINAASFVAVIIALLLMRVSEMHPAVRERPARGQFRAGLACVRSSPELFGAAMWLATFAPTLRWQIPVLVVVGAAGVSFAAVANTRLQLHTAPAMRGRVMALYAIAVFGTRVIGGPIVGWFGEHVGTRASLGIGAVAVTVALPVWLLLRPSEEAARFAEETAWESAAPE